VINNANLTCTNLEVVLWDVLKTLERSICFRIYLIYNFYNTDEYYLQWLIHLYIYINIWVRRDNNTGVAGPTRVIKNKLIIINRLNNNVQNHSETIHARYYILVCGCWSYILIRIMRLSMVHTVMLVCIFVRKTADVYVISGVFLKDGASF
jgi:hypothetical protein